jgi:uncharacterized protein YaeQ
MNIELSDVDRSVYQSLSFRVAQHPSEGMERLVTRIFAYALLYEEGLEFGRGLAEADEPALWTHDLTGQLEHWVDVGTPGADRIHLAAKKASRVTIVCHRTEESLARETQKKKLHRAGDIRVLLIDPTFIKDAAAALDRNNDWNLVHTDGSLTLSIGDRHLTGTLRQIPLPQ